MKTWQKLILGILILGAIIALTWLLPKSKTEPAKNPETAINPPPPPPPPAAQTRSVADPLSDAKVRVTKKPFGIHVTPKSSPISPEKFTGYHTGTDFEILPGEQDAGVPFYAICEGRILKKETARGYGGMLVQACTINGQDVTVVYGHVSLKSVSKKIGDNLSKSEQIGNLGQPPTETDGERKHLHLGIHKGTTIDTRGYVSTEPQLTGWLDFQKLP
jgi:hypothetical protein